LGFLYYLFVGVTPISNLDGKMSMVTITYKLATIRRLLESNLCYDFGASRTYDVKEFNVR